MSEPTPSRKLVGVAVLRDPIVLELLAMRLIGVLATLEPDGVVHAVPMWLAPGDGAVLLATGSRSRKVRNLERDPRATLVLHDSRPGAEVCGASIRGRVELVRGEDAVALVRAISPISRTAASTRWIIGPSSATRSAGRSGRS